MKYNGTDKYCYKEHHGVLINNFNIKDDDLLDKKIISEQMLIIDNISISYPYNLKTLCEIHREMFSCAFKWAGKIRDIDISKGTTRFCSNPYIEKEGNLIFNRVNTLHKKFLSKPISDFTNDEKIEYIKELGKITTDLNYLHPFREGNGRTLRLFIELFLHNLGINLSWPSSPDRWMKASIEDNENEFTSLILENMSI
ncbi:Fic/DOC family protein [Proteus mirabilis]|uniref:Fic/DOC family protein n=1 Tax=Proteus mirabilis TaxID=584 RepID=UPI00295AA642|nr:Fic family protein [Proteus mirabilis]WOT32639.1 Fic family protein [Proteus mirabilis]HEI8904580.1 Fic family protein [Proteus mirabilis]HEK3219461.1 Fic family protein [Proteus mirabilis]